jgi:UDP-xylose/UDP-N-acetylglucosamine transporter B4
MAVLHDSTRRGSASQEAPAGDLEHGPTVPSIAHHIAKLVGHEIGPSLLTVSVMLSLIFGGCCSNVRCYSTISPPPTTCLTCTDSNTALLIGLRS